VVVTDEQKSLRAAAGLVADEVIAEALARDATQGEAEALQALGKDGADSIDVEHVVGAAVVVHQAREELDLLIAPAVEPGQEVSHGRYGNVSASGRQARADRRRHRRHLHRHRGPGQPWTARPR